MHFKRNVLFCSFITIILMQAYTLSQAKGRSRKYMSPVTIDSFNKAITANEIGGGTGAWVSAPTDPGLKCKSSFDEDIKVGEAGHSLKIEYDMRDSHKYVMPKANEITPAIQKPAASASCGYFTHLLGIDLSGYDNLVMWMKGSKENGYTSKVDIEIKSDNNTARYTIVGISDKWKKFKVPLWKLRSIKNWTHMKEIVLVFGENITNKNGVIWIDDISFE